MKDVVEGVYDKLLVCIFIIFLGYEYMVIMDVSNFYWNVIFCNVNVFDYVVLYIDVFKFE